MVRLILALFSVDKLFLLYMRSRYFSILDSLRNFVDQCDGQALHSPVCQTSRELVLLNVCDPLFSLVRSFSRFEKSRNPDVRIRKLIRIDSLSSLAWWLVLSSHQNIHVNRLVYTKLKHFLNRGIAGIDRIVACQRQSLMRKYLVCVAH